MILLENALKTDIIVLRGVYLDGKFGYRKYNIVTYIQS